ncbi:MAG TPA: MAPEG family protein [Xanthomonadaceae bacterium]|jgi:glutathione S-transferase|nr:MAPEG family protein [Xanthomonadaceae bacterium]
MTHLPDLVALLAIAVFFGCCAAVGRGRSKYQIVAPATTGHPDFERLFRVQMNTLEAIVLFLPALWLATRYANPALVGGIGLIWVIGRIWYAIAYAGDAKKRGPGFGMGLLATAALWLIAGWGVVVGMMAG